ncbi:uncharacterized protein [Diadema setosum]|uniref:uncharacterized protein n=1 Tax=Diadema setosum TaxID=31175 RepID=UPI003B3B5229
MEATAEIMGDESKPCEEGSEPDDKREDIRQSNEILEEQEVEEDTRVDLEEEFDKWTKLKDLVGLSGIKSDARLAAFLIDFWYGHRDCTEPEKKETKKGRKHKQRYESSTPAPKIKIPVRMTSRGRPVYKPNILQVKLTSDYRKKKSKRQVALQKKQDAIKKANQKKGVGRKKKVTLKVKTSVKSPKKKSPASKPHTAVWPSDDEDDGAVSMEDNNDDRDYRPQAKRGRGRPKLVRDEKWSDEDGNEKDRRSRQGVGAARGKRKVRRGEKLPPKKRKYLDKTRLKGETWYRCRIKKMMAYRKKFQCKICLEQMAVITEVIDHIQNEHPDQIREFRATLGPHLERCGLTVVWQLPDSEVGQARGTSQDVACKTEEKEEEEVGPQGDGNSNAVSSLSKLDEARNERNEGEENSGERGNGDGFAMGGGILKGGYMSLLVGDERSGAASLKRDGKGDGNEKKGGDDEEGGERREPEGRRAVALLGDGQTDDLFKDRHNASESLSPEEDVDVLYELQGWIVIMVACPDCSEFVSIYSLPKHQFHHSKPRQDYPCDKCKKVYRRPNLLRNHQKKHLDKPPKGNEEEKTFMCELCGDVFRKAKYLKNHQLRHQGNLPFVCKICGRRFLFQRQLKRHDIIHRDVKPILCQECGRGFVQRSQLNAHMRQHTGEKPYKCDMCERAFTHNVSLKTHKKRDHGIDVGRCANPHLGRPKRSGEAAPKSKSSKSASAKKVSQTRNQSVINNPPVSQYSECRMVAPPVSHLPMGLVINPDRQGMDLSMESPESPPPVDNSRQAMMPTRLPDRSHRDRQDSIERSNATIHNLDSHPRGSHGDGHSPSIEHLGNPHIERSVISMDRHGPSGNTSCGSGGGHSHAHFERSMGMPLLERSLSSHLTDRQGLSPPIDSRTSNAHGHHMGHHHQAGIPLIARPDLNQHLIRQKKGKELDQPPHQSNPPHPPYPWGAWGNVGDGMGMRFPVFPQ